MLAYFIQEEESDMAARNAVVLAGNAEMRQRDHQKHKHHKGNRQQILAETLSSNASEQSFSDDELDEMVCIYLVPNSSDSAHSTDTAKTQKYPKQALTFEMKIPVTSTGKLITVGFSIMNCQSAGSNLVLDLEHQVQLRLDGSKSYTIGEFHGRKIIWLKSNTEIGSLLPTAALRSKKLHLMYKQH